MSVFLLSFQLHFNPFIYGVPGLNAGLALRDFMFLHHACACKLVIPVVSSKSSQCRLYVSRSRLKHTTEIVGNCPKVHIKQILIGVTLTNSSSCMCILHTGESQVINMYSEPDMTSIV